MQTAGNMTAACCRTKSHDHVPRTNTHQATVRMQPPSKICIVDSGACPWNRSSRQHHCCQYHLLLTTRKGRRRLSHTAAAPISNTLIHCPWHPIRLQAGASPLLPPPPPTSSTLQLLTILLLPRLLLLLSPIAAMPGAVKPPQLAGSSVRPLTSACSFASNSSASFFCSLAWLQAAASPPAAPPLLPSSAPTSSTLQLLTLLLLLLSSTAAIPGAVKPPQLAGSSVRPLSSACSFASSSSASSFCSFALMSSTSQSMLASRCWYASRL